jgi:hypothetical protein
MYGYMPWFRYPVLMPMSNQTPFQPLPFRHSQCDMRVIIVVSRGQSADTALPALLLQAQAVQAQPIPALHPPDNTQLEEPLFARCRPPPDVQLFCPECIPETFAAAVASPPTVPVVVAPLRLWYGNATAVVMMVVVVMSRGVQWQLTHHAP